MLADRLELLKEFKDIGKGIRLVTTQPSLVKADILSFLAAFGHFFWWPPSCFCAISLELYTHVYFSNIKMMMRFS
jgi:hypothetical protein